MKFRHKLWLQRLPPAVLRHHRDDHEDGVPMQPDCALCLSRGIRTPETLIHVFMQCTGADRLTHLRLKINNVFRQYLRLSVHSDYDSREQLLYLTADDPDIQSHPGWTRVHTDKLDRKQIRDMFSLQSNSLKAIILQSYIPPSPLPHFPSPTSSRDNLCM